MAEAKQWQVVMVKDGVAASPKALATKEAAVEAARLFAVAQGARGWGVQKLSPAVVLLFGQEGGGWCCLISQGLPVVADAPKPRRGSRAAAAPDSVASPEAVN